LAPSASACPVRLLDCRSEPGRVPRGDEQGGAVPQFAKGGDVGKDERAAGLGSLENGEPERLIQRCRGEYRTGGQLTGEIAFRDMA
jgi:hypothetical protein